MKIQPVSLNILQKAPKMPVNRNFTALNVLNDNEHRLPGYNLSFGMAQINSNLKTKTAINQDIKADIESKMEAARRYPIYCYGHTRDLVLKYKDNPDALKYIANCIDLDNDVTSLKATQAYLGAITGVFEESGFEEKEQNEILKNVLLNIKDNDGKTIPQRFAADFWTQRYINWLTEDNPQIAFEIYTGKDPDGKSLADLIIEQESVKKGSKKFKSTREEINAILLRLSTETDSIDKNDTIRLLQANKKILDKTNAALLKILLA